MQGLRFRVWDLGILMRLRVSMLEGVGRMTLGLQGQRVLVRPKAHGLRVFSSYMG